MRRPRLWILFAAVLLRAAAPPAFGAFDLVTVAPGGTERFEGAASSCPTFHWGGGDGTRRVELVVYRLDEDSAQAVESSSSPPAVRVVLPGAARGWTPSLEECLAPGRYAWAVRGVGGGSTASEWSPPRLFQVAPRPSGRELSAAIELLRRYAEAGPFSEPPEVRGVGVAPGSAVARASRSLHPAGPAQVSLPGTAAFRAEATEVSGESHGVAAITHSPEGFALAGENVGGGPDLLLRGDVAGADAQMSESALDRPSETDQTFEFLNSLGGSMTLRVDGVDVVTVATDQDTLAALACDTAQVAQWNGSVWQCASTGTDTLASLGCSTDQLARFGGSVWQCSADRDSLAALSCGQDQVAQWNGAAWVCADPGDTLADLACADNQVAHRNGTVWVCGQPAVTHHTCTDSGFPGDCTVNCPVGSRVWAGGCTSGGNDYLKINGPTGGASGPSGWRCQSGDLLGSSSSVTANLYCVVE
jgi:hypothetical protein